MSDQCEEQQMEQEALEAIFDDSLQVLSAEQPFHWAITIFPEQHGAEAENHVGITLKAKIPLDYPEGESLPDFDVDIVKGLTEEHAQELKQIANEEAEANRGMPVVFAVCERLREWLAENNQAGMDDVSMYAQMMRKQKEQEKREVSFFDIEMFSSGYRIRSGFAVGRFKSFYIIIVGVILAFVCL